jgi:type VI secretion system protein ImpE
VTAKEYFQAGKLNEAIAALNQEVRDNPTDVQRRTFLFELLCFAGEYDRAEKQLNLLADQGQQAQLGAMVYFSALHAERIRTEKFRNNDFLAEETTTTDRTFRGTLNGKPFESLEDGDPRIGPRLELFAAGAYLWIPLEHIESIEMQAPKRLRDLLWIPTLVRTGPSFKQRELGEILVPALFPLSFEDQDENVKLGRATEFRERNGETLPAGQKTFLVDGEDFPILEVRKIEFEVAEEIASAGQAGE